MKVRTYFPLPEFLSILCAIAPTAHALTTTLFLRQAAEWHGISQLNVSQAEHTNVSSRFCRVSARLGDAHITRSEKLLYFIFVFSSQSVDSQQSGDVQWYVIVYVYVNMSYR